MPESHPANSGETVAWHELTTAEALRRWDVTETGLATEEARQRLARHGPNVLPRPAGEGPLELVWRQINNPLIWVLIGSATLATLLGRHLDGAVVLAVVVLNTIIGFIQEFKAGKAIEALTQMVPDTATVLRDGRRVSVPAAELVPGDVVALQSGDKVPADMRLIQVRNLQVAEAALTGESTPTPKQVAPVAAQAAVGDRLSMVFGGTLVTYGTGTAVVVATGARTELGRISIMLKEATSLETPLTKALAVIAKYITLAILIVTAVLLAIGTVRPLGQGVALGAAFQEALIFAIALAVAAIPEGLPAIVTIALAIGVQRMADRRAVIRKLPAVETLGSTTVICSDKTGTLTRNEMTVKEIWTPADAFHVTGAGYQPHGELLRNQRPVTPIPAAVQTLLRDAALCNDAHLRHEHGQWHITGDPTEAALVVAAEKFGLRVEEARRSCPRVDAIPFESENQFMATLHDQPDGGQRIILKGAPEAVLRRCVTLAGGRPLEPQAVLHEVERLAAAGMRVLAVAARTPAARLTALQPQDAQTGFELLGLQGMLDPPRPEAIAAVQACHAAGITVKMITGDHHGTAQAIGAQLGLSDNGGAVTGTQLAQMDDARLHDVAGRVNVFARFAPEHKLRLVRALQARGEVVAMTGDGVNDAPALKQANIGVAMGITGTAVSKEAADIVLTDDNFASIAAAVEEGRRVYDNLIKSLAFVLPTNLGLAFILMFAVLFFPIDAATQALLLPMRPVQLLWINLVATVALALPLAFEAKEPNVMRRPPRRPDAPVLSPFVITRTVVVAILMSAGAIGLFHYEYTTELARGVAAPAALAQAQTMAVTTVIMFQIFYMLNCRSLRDSIFAIGLFSNPPTYVGIAALLLLQLAFVYLPFMQWLFGTSPLGLAAWLKSALLGAVVLPVIGAEKWWRQRRAAATTATA